jgi:uncharacterized zinc-type alcohol dehydrogenase-like protein
MAKTGPLLCGGVTVFAPLVINNVRGAGRVGVIGIGGLGHMALQFANKWGCEVHAFTTSENKEAEAKGLGAHFVHNTKKPDALKKLAGSLDLIISTVNVALDVAGLLDARGAEIDRRVADGGAGDDRRDAGIQRAALDRADHGRVSDVEGE